MQESELLKQFYLIFYLGKEDIQWMSVEVSKK